MLSSSPSLFFFFFWKYETRLCVVTFYNCFERKRWGQSVMISENVRRLFFKSPFVILYWYFILLFVVRFLYCACTAWVFFIPFYSYLVVGLFGDTKWWEVWRGAIYSKIIFHACVRTWPMIIVKGVVILRVKQNSIFHRILIQ